MVDSKKSPSELAKEILAANQEHEKAKAKERQQRQEADLAKTQLARDFLQKEACLQMIELRTIWKDAGYQVSGTESENVSLSIPTRPGHSPKYVDEIRFAAMPNGKISVRITVDMDNANPMKKPTHSSDEQLDLAAPNAVDRMKDYFSRYLELHRLKG